MTPRPLLWPLSLSLLLLFALHCPAQDASSTAQHASADTSSTGTGQPNFFARFAEIYRSDWNPPPAAAAPAPGAAPEAAHPERLLPSPVDAPPFPSADWGYGGSPEIGAPNPTGTPLMTALYGPAVAARKRTQIYGWIEPGFNFSTSSQSNLPAGYDLYPNRFELDQAVLYVERLPNTVQTDHFDYGYHATGWFGTDYRYTTQKGILSDQLIKYNRQYGFDFAFFYLDFYLPHVARGMNLRIGRFAGVPGIEVEAAPSNYIFSHSLLSIYSPFTMTGVVATFKLNKQWLVQGGITAGGDIAPWADGAKPSAIACLNYSTATASNNYYLCANGINSGNYAYDNVQHYDLTWYHRFSKTVHIASEGWYMYQHFVPSVTSGIAPVPGSDAAYCAPGELRCTAPAFAVMNYLNKELSPKLYVSLRTEFFDDQKGQRTGYQTRYSEHTLTLGKWIGTTVLFRPGIRWAHSYDTRSYNNGRNHSQFTFASDVIFHF